MTRKKNSSRFGVRLRFSHRTQTSKSAKRIAKGLDKTFGDIRVNFYKTKASKSLLSLGHLLDQGVHTKQIVGFKKGSYYSKPLK